MSFDQAWELHDRAARAQSEPGCVYTPRKVALQLAELVLSQVKIAPTLLDPACGSGALLLGALEWAATERTGWIEFWLNGGMSGWDLDGTAVQTCNQVISEALDIEPAEIAAQQDGLYAEGEYDCVIANPPWISFSGRHARDIEPNERKKLAKRFPAFAGWPALHTAFAEQCGRLTRQGDGRLGLLLPMQMADLPGYEAARKAVTARALLEHAIELGEGVFEGVTEPTGMFVFGAGGREKRTWLPDADSELLEALRNFEALPADSFGDVGVHTGNAAKLLVAKQGEGKPLRVGRDIEAFSLASPTHVLLEPELPEGMYARVAPEQRYQDAVIVLRQTASRPIAAKHEPWAYFRNSVLACYGAPGHDVDYLLGVLNSEMVARIHRAKHRDARQRTFPQLKIGHLRGLPIPGPEIGAVYTKIANASRAVQAGEPQARDDLEVLVAQAYGL